MSMTENEFLLYKALLEAYNSLDDWEEIVLEAQEQIVLPRNQTIEPMRKIILNDEYTKVLS